MSIELQTENTNDFSEFIDTMPEAYSMFEVTFKMYETGLTIKAHSHIVFPKCKELSFLERDETGAYLVRQQIERQYFETFLNLLYGNDIMLDFFELESIRAFATELKYSQLDKIRETVLNNIDKISYSDDNNQMTLLLDLINSGVFPQEDILSKCKLSQLKRLKDMTDDTSLLRNIIAIILLKYSTDTNSIRTHHQKILNDTIGHYETRIRKLDPPKTYTYTC